MNDGSKAIRLPKITGYFGEIYPFLVTFLVYLFFAQLTRGLFFSIPGSPAIILLPAGIALATLLIFGYKVLPAIMLAALINGVMSGTQPFLSLIVAIGNTLQAFVGAFLLQVLKFDKKLARVRDILALIFVSILVTLIGPLSRLIGSFIIGVPLQTSWQLVWLANILSVVIITPIAVRWFFYPNFKKIRKELLETIIVFILLLLVDFIVHWTPYTRIGDPKSGLPIAIFQLAIFGWIAIRMGMSRTTLAFFITTILALSGLYFGFNKPELAELPQRIIGLELYVILFAMIFYITTAINEERDLAMQELRDLNRQKSEFISIIAHELRNPLAPIVNHLWLMKGDSNPQNKENITAIEKQVKKITILLEDLLDVSRISEGKIQLHKEKFDIKEAIRSTVQDATALFSSKKQEVKLNFDEIPIWISADPVRINQIMFNILHNASKYTDQNGKIEISCRLKDNNVLVSVKDNGIGMPKEMLPSIFDIFVKGRHPYSPPVMVAPHNNSTTRLYDGLGVGLKLAKAFTDLHGGSITAESEGLGKGSTFIINLPVFES